MNGHCPINMKIDVSYNVLWNHLTKTGASAGEFEALNTISSQVKRLNTIRNSYAAPDYNPPVVPIVNRVPVNSPLSYSVPLVNMPTPKAERLPQPVARVLPARQVEQPEDPHTWTHAEEQFLLNSLCVNRTIMDMVKGHQRTPDTIVARLQDMGAISEPEELNGYAEYAKNISVQRAMNRQSRQVQQSA